jgi:hypothetical protein
MAKPTETPSDSVQLSEDALKVRYEVLPETQRMSNWYNIFSLFGTVLNISVTEIFRSRFDFRTLQAVLLDHRSRLDSMAAPSTDDGQFSVDPKYGYFKYECAENQHELWFDYAADVGDGFNSTYYVASLLARDTLRVQNKAKEESQTGRHCPSGSTDADSESLPRGRFLILGGDQVYPSASRDGYELRFTRVYEAAAYSDRPPHRARAPHMYAVPGNHDWYDGLSNFMEVFAEGRAIGQWRTQQHASYFAIQLPYKYWIFAIDIGLGGELDERQVLYFQSLVSDSAAVEDGSRVILCIAEPDWVKARPNVRNLRDGLFYFERKLADKLVDSSGVRTRDVRVVLRLAGDLHHYRRHESSEPLHPSDASLKQNPKLEVPRTATFTVQNITAGGGGAFLHPTHDIDEERSQFTPSPRAASTVGASNVTQHPPGFQQHGITFQCQDHSTFPSFAQSSQITKQNAKFAFRNPWMFLSLIVVYGAVINFAAFLDANGHQLWIGLLLGVLLAALLSGTKEFALSEASGEVGEAKRGRSRGIYHSKRRRDVAKRWGLVHGIAQFCVLLAFCVSGIVLSRTVSKTLPACPHSQQVYHSPSEPAAIAEQANPPQSPTCIDQLGAPSEAVWSSTMKDQLARVKRGLHNWPGKNDADSLLRFVISLFTAAVGAFVSMLVFGLYLFLGLNHSKHRLHANGAFASLGIEDYKNFLRIRVSNEGITVYPIGIRKVPRHWLFVARSANHEEPDKPRPLFIPQKTDTHKHSRKEPTDGDFLRNAPIDSQPFLIEKAIEIPR